MEAVEPRSRRDRGVTALIEGFLGMAWFGWGQANASPGLSAVLTAGSVLSALVAIAGGAHFFALAPLLEDRMLIPLGALTTAVAVTALVTGLATPTAPSSVTGAGAGTLLLVFAALALLGAGSARLRPRDRGAQPR